MKSFHCGQCGQLVFFENVRCERCEAPLGYIPDLGEVSAFAPADDGTAQPAPGGRGQALPPLPQLRGGKRLQLDDSRRRGPRRRHTLRRLPAHRHHPQPGHAGQPAALVQGRGSQAPAAHTLDMLGLPIGTGERQADRPMRFAFKESTDDEPIFTGHADGLVTLNIAEADDAGRERMRAQMHEPYRTLLGHFRHEIGHYYFDRTVRGTHWIEPFRARFGDERADYRRARAALRVRHAAGVGGPIRQQLRHHASLRGLGGDRALPAHRRRPRHRRRLRPGAGPGDERLPQLSDQTAVDEASFHNLMQRWFPLTYALNSLNRSLGAPDAYPFALAPAVVAKLRFVHDVVSAARRTGRAAMAPAAQPRPGRRQPAAAAKADGAAQG